MDAVLSRLERIERLLESQNLIIKEVLNFNEAALYLDISQSHLYKLTSTSTISHYKPNGKKIYFKRAELDLWLMQNRQATTEEITAKANNFILGKGGRNV